MTLADRIDDLPPAPFSSGALCEALLREGWYVGRLSRHRRMLSVLAAEVAAHRADEALAPAGVGRADDHQLAGRIRRDRILWLDGASLAQKAWLAFAERLRLELNRQLMLGLFRYEAHFALYETGGFYRRHRDSFRGARNRIVSTVLYLNEGWTRGDGGLLRLYDDAEAVVTGEVIPAFGTFAVFLSEEIPHEVTEAARPRASIAGWYRVNDMIEAPALQNTGLVERL